MSMTYKCREELRIAMENAASLTVTPDLYKVVVDLWWSRCERSEEIINYVFSQLLGYPFRKQDFAQMSPRARRGIYAFTSKHMFPGGTRGPYVAEVVAAILIEGEQEELLNVYYARMLSRKARLEHKALQNERDYQWVQSVLKMLERRNPPLRLQGSEGSVVEGEVRL